MTTKILVEKVEDGAKYQDMIYDYWITCVLRNYGTIILFDYIPLDLTNYLNKNLEISIKALFIEKGVKDNLRNFQGEIIKKDNSFYFINDFIAIEVSKEDIDNEKIDLNILENYSFGRLDIKSIKV